MRQQQSTSAESTAQINILIQKLGLEVLCFIPTLTIQAVTLCQIVFSQRFVCVCVCTVLIRVLMGELFRAPYDREEPLFDTN